jgi:hypothetical protein
VLFDSFQRANQTWFPVKSTNPTLGSLELGGQAWNVFMSRNGDANRPSYIGILEGRAVPLSGFPQPTATVTCGSANHKVWVKNDRRTWKTSNGRAPHTALTYRGVDNQNFYMAWSEDGGSYGNLRVCQVVGDSISVCDGGIGIPTYALPESWTHIVVNASGTTHTFYAKNGDAGAPVLLGSITGQTTHLTGTKAGFTFVGANFGLDRCSEFAAFAAD